MQDFIMAHPFGALITSSASTGLFATHMPWLLDRSRGAHGVLQGHMARANPHHGLSDGGPSSGGPPSGAPFDDRPEALVLFTGPDAYVTPSWYPTKTLHGKVVPTWNYVAVHVYGRLQIIDDRDFLMRHLDVLTERHEDHRAHPWAMHDAPQEYLDQLVKAIVGVELEVTRLEGKWKLSQNRSSADVDGVIDGLSASASAQDRDVGALVRAAAEKLSRAH